MLDTPNADLIRDAFERLKDLGPFDSVDAVARRMCVRNGIPECIASGCTEATCEHAADWYADAQAVIEIAKTSGPPPPDENVRKLVEAAEPFAAYAKRIDDGFDSQGYGDATPLHLSPEADATKAIIKLGDCRKIRAALSDQERGGVLTSSPP
jgi:hypothetical protein